MKTNTAPRIPRDRLPVGTAFAATLVLCLGFWCAVYYIAPPTARALIHFLAWLLS